MGRENKICFTDSQGDALFTIPDGGMIKLAYGNGDENYAICRYLTKPMQRLTVWIIPFWSLHREWSETVSVMLPHKTGNKIMNDKEV